MKSPDEREQYLQRKEQELDLLKQELLLEKQAIEQQKRQLQIIKRESSPYPNSKHNQLPIQLGGKKLIQLGKFVVFVVVGIGIIQAGFLLGIWLSRMAIAALIALIGYKIFLENDSDNY